MSYNYLPLDRKWVNFQQVKNLLDYEQNISITFDAHERIIHCRNYLDNKLQDGNLYYGINTGFGYLQDVAINPEQSAALQENLLKSHACGIGDEVPEPIVRLMLMLKIKSLSYGHSGVHIETVKRLMDMYNEGVIPVVYTQGSLGASGDLAPLSHLSLPLIGLGQVYYNNKKRPAADVLEQLGWKPLQLHSKEGLALINGTQFMCAYGLFALKKAEHLIKMANVVSALSYDAFDCSPDPLHPQLQSIRQMKGQAAVAATVLHYLQGSEILKQKKQQLQDPYSFRCIPQVHGATRDVFDNVLQVFVNEMNSVTDNPNIFPDQDLIVSGGNFHGQPLALHFDYLSIAMSEIGNIAERRIYQLISGQRNLPLFLVKDQGLNSGFMIPQYTAASIVSENKTLCTPASVDSISSSNNQEDHVSMGATAATKCLRVVDNIEKILGIELMCAAQAMAFRTLPTSPYLQALVNEYRQQVSFADHDRVLHYDIVSSINFLRSYSRF